MVPTAIIGGIVLNLLTLWDVFRTLILPRRAVRRFRMTETLDHATWAVWSGLARRLRGAQLREAFLSYFGPLELLIHLLLWAILLIVGFAWIRWGLAEMQNTGHGHGSYGTNLFSSAATFFTLTSSLQPRTAWEQLVTAVEVGMGFGLLTLVIAYLPQLYSTFSRREVKISRFDQRAGTPPNALQLFQCVARGNPSDTLPQRLDEWEEWAAEILEGHISYPVLAYFRSQHSGQSWVSTLTTMLDASAFIQVGLEGIPAHPADLAFDMAQHTAGDLCHVLGVQPHPPDHDRLPPDTLAAFQRRLSDSGYSLRCPTEQYRRLAELRGRYEPYVYALATYLLMPLPTWLPDKEPSGQ